MHKADIIQKLETIQNLPTLPIVAQQIVKLIKNPISNMGQIADVITQDQAVSARVLRLTNSAFFGFSNRISSIQHAIVILGLNAVKNLVLGVSVVRTFEELSEKTLFKRELFWLHAFSTAVGAKLLARQLHKKNEEDFFLAGLLHDIGLLVIDQFFHDHFAAILEQSQKEKRSFIECEVEHLGMAHGKIGSFLGARWNLPQYLNSCMQFHHTPRHLSDIAAWDSDIIDLVHIADVRSRETGGGDFVPNFGGAIDETIVNKVAIPETDFTEIFKQVKENTSLLMQEWGV